MISIFHNAVAAAALSIAPVGDDETHVKVVADYGGKATLTLHRINGDALGPSMFGSQKRNGDQIEFRPAVKLSRGATYRAILKANENSTTVDYQVPELEATAPKLTAIFPTPQQLPANLLKFYLYFDQPMREGRAIFDQVHLEDIETGKRVDAPWRRQELWTEDARRLTLWIHPGRVKRGVNLREDLGPVLYPDRKYALIIDATVRGANGAPIGKEVRHEFSTLAEDYTRPLPEDWTLTLPKANTRAPLKIASPEPLDHALIWKLVSVLDPDGKPLSAKIDVDEGERSWFIEPAKPWAAGEHQLKIDGTLEDLAGNTPQRVFDNDLTQPQGKPGVESISFTPKS